MTAPLRELDRRTNDRIDVALLWRQHDNRVLVAVTDELTGARFEMELRDGEKALDVFRHPFAYAGLRGIDTRPFASRLYRDVQPTTMDLT
jgi:hypothetical protein